MAEKPRGTIRAFVALDLDSTSVRRIARVADRLRMGSGAASATWVSPADIHVTLKFMGELPMDAAAPLADSLRPLVEGKAAPHACSFRLSAFPSLEEAHVIIAKLQDSRGELAKLADRVGKIAGKLGIEGDERSFTPHVTLARLKRAYDARRWLRVDPAEGAGECRASTLTLFQSELGSSGARHIPLARFVFS